MPSSDVGSYVGRFAPSPSGPLHFGSLVAALGSYLDAKFHHGRWLVRIEDIDTPRVKAGADLDILKTLEAFSLHWDGEVIYQSQRLARYEEVAQSLAKSNLTYLCNCSRKDIKSMGGVYDNRCRAKTSLSPDNTATRLKQQDVITEFCDRLQGNFSINTDFACEDYIIKRRDGLFAYQLVVVVDDLDQGITDVVRGADLIDTTGRQMALMQQLGGKAPRYMHLPLAVAKPGFKLSKQNYAPAVDTAHPELALLDALTFLGFDCPQSMRDGNVEQILEWAVTYYDPQHLPRHREIQLSQGADGNSLITPL